MPTLFCNYCGTKAILSDRDLRIAAGTAFTCRNCGQTRKLPMPNDVPASPGPPTPEPVTPPIGAQSQSTFQTPLQQPTSPNKASSPLGAIGIAFGCVFILFLIVMCSGLPSGRNGGERVYRDSKGNTMTESEVNKVLYDLHGAIEAEKNPYDKAYLEGFERALKDEKRRLDRQ